MFYGDITAAESARLILLSMAGNRLNEDSMSTAVGEQPADEPDSQVCDSESSSEESPMAACDSFDQGGPNFNTISAAAGGCQDECKSEIDGIKLELEILRSQVDALQSVINSQDVYSPNNVDNVINDTMKMQIEICDLNIKNKKLETELCLLSNENRHTIGKLVGRIRSNV